MNAGELLLVLFRWVHVLAAITALGGSFYVRLVLMPAAAQTLAAEAQGPLREALIRRWKKIVHTCIALLLISGGYNLWLTISRYSVGGVYEAIFSVKLLAAFAVFFLAIALTGQGTAFAKFRAENKKWLTVLCLLGLIVVLASGVLKNLPHSQRAAPSSERPTVPGRVCPSFVARASLPVIQ